LPTPGHVRAAAALALVCPLAAAARPQLATLRTSDTTVRLRASPARPEWLSLGTGGSAWRNRESEPLVEFAVAGGARVALEWRWNRRQSRVGPRSVSFVYDCARPRLRLRWEWTARAARGPLEHTVSIENLGDGELGLGLPESLRFAFAIEPSAELEMLSVEKGGGAPGPAGALLRPVAEGDRWEGRSSTYARESP
jgi:hypothetical protein